MAWPINGSIKESITVESAIITKLSTSNAQQILLRRTASFHFEAAVGLYHKSVRSPNMMIHEYKSQRLPKRNGQSWFALQRC